MALLIKLEKTLSCRLGLARTIDGRRCLVETQLSMMFDDQWHNVDNQLCHISKMDFTIDQVRRWLECVARPV